MKKADTPEPENLWKNQRLIDENGLVICEDRQRLFDNHEAAMLFESLLKIYQEKGLGFHYLYIGLDVDGPKRSYETVCYKAYVRFRCVQKVFDGGRKVIGNFYIQYQILRIDPVKYKLRYPFLLLFRPYCGERECEQCEDTHYYKIFQSSLYVIRSQFISMIRDKIFFMERYPAYNFQPFDFTEKRNSGDVIYEFIRDHNYEPSYYFQKSEEIICNTIRMNAIKKSMDFQIIRLDTYKQMVENNAKEIQHCMATFEKHACIYKLKYMCRKCNPKQIWTTKNQCTSRISVIKMEALPQGDDKIVYDRSGDIKEDFQLKCRTEESFDYNQILHNLFQLRNKIFFSRRFDRSLKKQVQDYEGQIQKLNTISRWHQTVQQYKYPVLVIISLQIPKMKCQMCEKEKEGLIYITNLLEELQSHLARQIIARVQKLMGKQVKVQN